MDGSDLQRARRRARVCTHRAPPHIHACVYTHTHTHVMFYGIAEKDRVSFSSWNNVFWENTKADGLH